MIKKLLITILFLSWLANPFWAIAETYGSDVITGGTVSCDTQYDGTTYACTNSVDRNESTFWMTTKTANPHWWKYDLGSGVSKSIDKLSIMVRNDGSGAQLKDFTFQGSNDGTSWTTIGTSQAADLATGYQDFTYTNPNSYRYYTATSTGNTWNTGEGGTNNVYIALFEVKGYECTDCDVVAPIPLMKIFLWWL